MRIKTRDAATVDVDMTPMIDMVFQLIAFFMILINFTDTEQDERVQLPSSALAKPPDAPLETPITIQLTRSGQTIIGGQPYAEIERIKPVLNNEVYVLRAQNRSEKSATIVIRAHKEAATGDVQKVIKVAQEVGFEKFTLRAMEDRGH